MRVNIFRFIFLVALSFILSCSNDKPTNSNLILGNDIPNIFHSNISNITIYDWGNGAASEAWNRIIDHYGEDFLNEEMERSGIEDQR
jgi:hypothetical protein